MSERKLPPTTVYRATEIAVALDDKLPGHAVLHVEFDGQAIGFRVPTEELRALSLRLFEAHRILSQSNKPN